MAKKKISAPPKSDFYSEEFNDVCGFTDGPLTTGECISSFSFEDDSTNESNVLYTNLSDNNIATSE